MTIDFGLQYQDMLFSHERMSVSVCRGLMDFRSATSILSTPSDYKQLVDRELDARKSEVFAPNAKVAILVLKPTHRVVFELYSAMMGRLGYSYATFERLKTAIEWLGLETSQIPKFMMAAEEN